MAHEGRKAEEKRALARVSHKPSIAIVGAGRLGTALALALNARGYLITALCARHQSHARRAASLLRAVSEQKLDSKVKARASSSLSSSLASSLAPSPSARSASPLVLGAAQLARLPPSDILLITTPDDRIAETAARLAALEIDGRRRVALHASGALSAAELAPMRARGFAVGSMHPLVSVSEPASGAERLRGAFFCVEGDPVAVRAARRLARALAGQSFTLASRHKALYHAAAVLASGHTVALFDLAAELLMRCGLPALRARRALLPLLRSTLENLAAQPPARALTGTFARADVATARRHLAAFNEAEARAALSVYIALGRHALRLAEQNGADAAALQQIARALDEA